MRQPINALNIIVGLSFLSGICISFKAWLPEGFQHRTVPNIPFNCAADFSAATDISWLVILLLACCIDILLVVSGVKYWSKMTKGIILAAIIMLVLRDQVRIQPWVFLYALFYLAAIVSSCYEEALKMTRNILAGMYFWAGVHKLNPAFIDNIILPILNVYEIQVACKNWGYIIPAFEIILSFILLIPHTRRTGAYLAVLMHAGIILHYCVFLKYNLIILPWNICCSVMVLISTFDANRSSTCTVRQYCKQCVLIIVSWVLPILNLFWGYPAYLSWSLYTGKDKIIMIAIKKSNVPSIFQQSITSYGSKGYEIINVTHWIMADIHVPVSPRDLRILEKIKEHLINHGNVLPANKSLMVKYPQFVIIP